MTTADTHHVQVQPAFEQNRRLGRGLNVLGYDPIWLNMNEARMQAHHFQRIREAGFDHVRINLHPFGHMGPAPDYRLPTAWFETLDWAMRHALDQELLVVLDLHEFKAMGDNAEGNHDRFLTVWSQLAQHTQGAPDRVLFELLNEPCRTLTPALWNRYLTEAQSLVRKTHPDRTLVIGPAHWYGIDHLATLELPEADRNIIVTVHYYKPGAFTHQGAVWSDYPNTVGTEWHGTDKEKAAIRRDFEVAQTWAQAHRRPLYLSEFGVYDKADMDSRTRYLRFVAREAEALTWSWAYWQFDSDFVVYDVGDDRWVKPVRNALTDRG
jgi:endoglucanase